MHEVHCLRAASTPGQEPSAVGTLHSRNLFCCCTRCKETRFDECLLKDFVDSFRQEKVSAKKRAPKITATPTAIFAPIAPIATQGIAVNADTAVEVLPEAKSTNAKIVNWIQCKTCEAWRIIPTTAGKHDARRKFFCTTNFWGADITCATPEDVLPYVEDDRDIDSEDGL